MRIASLVVFALWSGVTTPLLAQSASQITPRTYAPPSAVPAPPIVIGEGPDATAPEGSAALFVTLAGVSIEEAPAASSAVTSAMAELRAQLVGAPVPVARIFTAARALEAAYARAGYVLVRVTVPAQQLVDGATLRLVVVDGFIERVETGGLPAPVHARIADLLGPPMRRRCCRCRGRGPTPRSASST